MENKPTARTKQHVFEVFRSAGYTQKESGAFVGVNQKTAGNYEKVRRKKINKKIADLDELILRLKNRADQPKITVSEMIDITAKLESLYNEREKLESIF